MKIILLWNPYSTNNIYYRSWRNGFIKKKPKELKESYILQARSQVKKKLVWDLTAKIYLYFWDKRRRDIDNFHKLSLDALSWIAYDDDSQVRELHIEKHYDKNNPRIEIELSEWVSFNF